MRILIVDDELHTREICSDFLEEENYEVETAGDGAEALEVLANKPPFQILLSDIQMPRLNGLELLKESRRLHPELEVVLMTGYGDLASAIEAIRFGAYDYITKPFTRDFLLKTLHRCSEKIELQQKLKESQAKLIEQEKLAALGAVAAWLSHRIRNSLSVMQMCAHYLKGKTAQLDSGEMNEVIKAILDKIKSLEKTTADFISYSRSYELQKLPSSINAVLEQVMEPFSVQSQIQNVALTKELDPALPEISCDPHLLHEAFENLLVNALQAIGTQAGQKLVVKSALARDGGQPRILVSFANSGSFIPPENRDKIFTAFFTTKEGGSGLGLAIVKRIVDQHQGTLVAESRESDGMKWTTITLSFPLESPEPALKAP